jgi:hypothetical protein
MPSPDFVERVVCHHAEHPDLSSDCYPQRLLGLFFSSSRSTKAFSTNGCRPQKNALPAAQAEAGEDGEKENRPSKLSNPFQQVPIRRIPQRPR